MGRNNQQRRAANKRKKARRGRADPRTRRRPSAPAGGAGRGASESSPPRLDELAWAAVAAMGVDDAGYRAAFAALSHRAEAAVAVLDDLLAEAVAGLWSRGWAPAEAVRAVSRQLSAAHGDLAAALVVGDGRVRAQHGQALHPRWQAQLSALAEHAVVDGHAGSADERLQRRLEVLRLLTRLPAVPPTMPRPGEAAAERPAAEGLDERVLARVRALLAKAEATEFDEEAEAFTAKAQELIARHAIDEALLHTVADVGEPSVRRIPVDTPYAEAKAVLLTKVGEANRCRVVHDRGCGWVTVFGYDGDLHAVEVLATSLLAQATAAMTRLGSRRDATGRSRTRSFRRSFLLGFASRIGERLRTVTEEHVAAAAGEDGALLPVLATRDERLEGAVAKAFPNLVHRSHGVSHAAGFVAGQAAADLADLDVSAGALGHTGPPGGADPAR